MTLTLPRRASRAFTLIELIVVIVVMGILVAVGAFAYNRTIESSHKHSARMMAEHIARDGSGISAAKQQPLSDLVGSSEVTDDLVAGDATKSGVDLELGTAGPNGDMYVGVVYAGYCTPVLFPGIVAKATVGTTRKAGAPGTCKTDNGTPPAGDPILDPDAPGGGADIGDPPGGDTGGDGGSGGVDTSYSQAVNGYMQFTGCAAPCDTLPTDRTSTVDDPAAVAMMNFTITDDLRDNANGTGFNGFAETSANGDALQWDASTDTARFTASMYPRVYTDSQTAPSDAIDLHGWGMPYYWGGLAPAAGDQVTVKLKFPAGTPTPLSMAVSADKLADFGSGTTTPLVSGAGWNGFAPDANGWVTITAPWTPGDKVLKMIVEYEWSSTTSMAPTGRISEFQIR